MNSHLHTKLPIITLLSATFFGNCAAWAGPVLTNQLGGTVPPGTKNYIKSRPFVCNVDNQEPHETLYFAIPPDGQQALHDPGPWPNVNTGIVRLGGCDANFDPYVGFIYNLAVPTLTPGNGFAVDSVAYNNGVLTGNIAFTAIPVTDTGDITAITPTIPAARRQLDFVGINLSGAEFGNTIAPYSIPDLSSNTAASTPGHSDLVTMKGTAAGGSNGYVKQGLNTVRLPISWSYLELLSATSTIQNPQWVFNSSYWNNFILPTLKTLTSAHINTIIDLHTYMHYSRYGEEYSGCGDSGYCPDGTLDTNVEDYKKVWGDIWAHIQTSLSPEQRSYIMFDLVNEPATDPAKSSEQLTPQQAFNVQMGVATTLLNSANNFPGKILIEGAYWSGLHSWSEDVGGFGSGTTNADVFTKNNIVAKLTQAGISAAKADNIIINVHQYFDSNFSGTGATCVDSLDSLNLQPFANWLTTQGLKAMVTEFGTPYNSAASCQPILNNFVKYMVDNRATEGSGGFIGATLWGAGRGWSPAYNLYVTPTSYQFTTLMQGAITP